MPWTIQHEGTDFQAGDVPRLNVAVVDGDGRRVAWTDSEEDAQRIAEALTSHEMASSLLAGGDDPAQLLARLMGNREQAE